MSNIVTSITSNPILALLKNKQLKNTVFWKQVQALLALLMGVYPVLRYLFPQYAELLNPSFLGELQGAVGSILAYLTVATTGKIGFGDGK